MTCSVAIATRDRPEAVERLINSLITQTRRPDQIIVIDDGALDEGRLDRWRTACESAGVRWLYRRKDIPGRSASRNLAARLSDGGAVFILDDDCEPAADCLAKLLGALEHPAGATLAAVEPVVPLDAGGQRYAAVLRAVGWWGLAPRCRSAGQTPPGVQRRRTLAGVVLVRRDVLLAEAFDESLVQGEDREWGVRVSRHGGLGRVIDARCEHRPEPAGRADAFAAGVRLARSYRYSQTKLFAAKGCAAGIASLCGLAAAEVLLSLGGGLVVRRAGREHLARAAGIIVGLLSPGGRRGEKGQLRD